jgi:hypothetical protein
MMHTEAMRAEKFQDDSGFEKLIRRVVIAPFMPLQLLVLLYPILLFYKYSDNRIYLPIW